MSYKVQTLFLVGLCVSAATLVSNARADGFSPLAPPWVAAPVYPIYPPAQKPRGFPQAYTLVLDGFNGHELMRAEGYLAAVPGFDHIRKIHFDPSYAEYWYESYDDIVRLHRHVRGMLDHMHVAGRVKFAGNVVRVVKTAVR